MASRLAAPAAAADIPGTPIFDGPAAMRGYALNRMCFSLNRPENRAAFKQDPDAYCDGFGLTEGQKAAVKSRDLLSMIAEGGNVYYLSKLAGVYGMNVQDMGAQQTGVSLEAFRAKLQQAAR